MWSDKVHLPLKGAAVVFFLASYFIGAKGMGVAEARPLCPRGDSYVPGHWLKQGTTICVADCIWDSQFGQHVAAAVQAIANAGVLPDCLVDKGQDSYQTIECSKENMAADLDHGNTNIFWNPFTSGKEIFPECDADVTHILLHEMEHSCQNTLGKWTEDHLWQKNAEEGREINLSRELEAVRKENALRRKKNCCLRRFHSGVNLNQYAADHHLPPATEPEDPKDPRDPSAGCGTDLCVGGSDSRSIFTSSKPVNCVGNGRFLPKDCRWAASQGPTNSEYDDPDHPWAFTTQVGEETGLKCYRDTLYNEDPQCGRAMVDCFTDVENCPCGKLYCPDEILGEAKWKCLNVWSDADHCGDCMTKADACWQGRPTTQEEKKRKMEDARGCKK